MTSKIEISGVSLSMVVLDEIRVPNMEPMMNVVGGAATFASLGQRILANRPHEVGCLIVAGHDFPSSVEEALREWGMYLVIRRRSTQNSTRGLLEYKDDTFGGEIPSRLIRTKLTAEAKSFRYTSGPLKASPIDLVGTSLLHAKSFHFLATPSEILEQIPELVKLRNRHQVWTRPFIVWEPLPSSSISENLPLFREACQLVDVFSPNHLELARLFDKDSLEPFDATALELCANELIPSIGAEEGGVLIVRAGEHGSLTSSRSMSAAWHPSFYPGGHIKVVDPTGAGNAFLGGYISGWQAKKRVNDAIAYAHVAASFAVEQIGLPTFVIRGNTILWNDVDVMNRLQSYNSRLQETA